MDTSPPSSGNERDVDLERIVGTTLLEVQWTERILEAALPVSFPKEAMTYGSVKADQDALERKPLGKLARALRERGELPPEFERLLTEFVESRNVFAHHLTARFDMTTPQGREAALSFCGNLSAVAKQVAEALSNSLRARLFETFMQLGVQISAEGFPPVQTYDDLKKVVVMIEEYLNDVTPTAKE